MYSHIHRAHRRQIVADLQKLVVFLMSVMFVLGFLLGRLRA